MSYANLLLNVLYHIVMEMKIRESCLQSGTFIYKPGISVTKQDFHLQMGSLGLQMGFSGYYLPDVSLDTIKSVENGRRAMSLDTYLNIVHALESSPMVLMSQQHPKKHIERFAFMMNRCDEREIEFALHMIEQILRGQEDYLSE